MIEKTIEEFGSKLAFCRAIGMKPQFLTQILKGDRPWPPRFAIAVERVSKTTQHPVTRHELRPDVFGSSSDEAAA